MIQWGALPCPKCDGGSRPTGLCTAYDEGWGPTVPGPWDAFGYELSGDEHGYSIACANPDCRHRECAETRGGATVKKWNEVLGR